MQHQSFGIHRSWIILALAIAAMIMLFAAASAAMIYLDVFRNMEHFELPRLFYFNTLLLLAASLLFRKAVNITDEPAALHRIYGIVLVLSLVFLGLQAIAWKSLLAMQDAGRATSFLYVLSGLHFVHVVGGLPFLATAMRRMHRRKGARRISSADQRAVRMLGIYWHFLDLLWIYLIVFLTALSWIHR